MSDLDKQFVYVIQHELGPVKIGRGKDPRQRVKDMQVGTPFKLKLLSKARPRDASKVERHLHRHFKKYHIRGEWFDIPKSDRDFEIPTRIDGGKPNTKLPLTEERDMDQDWADLFERAYSALTHTRYRTNNFRHMRNEWNKLLSSDREESEEPDVKDDIIFEAHGKQRCHQCGHLYEPDGSGCPTCDYDTPEGRGLMQTRR